MSHPIQEEDRVGTFKIIATAVVSLAIFGVGVVWSISIQRNEQHSIVQEPGALGPAAAGAPEVGIVYQWPFFSSHYAADKVNEKRQRLETYGWVDKQANIVHIPIDRAIERYVREAGGNK